MTTLTTQDLEIVRGAPLGDLQRAFCPNFDEYYGVPGNIEVDCKEAGEGVAFTGIDVHPGMDVVRRRKNQTEFSGPCILRDELLRYIVQEKMKGPNHDEVLDAFDRTSVCHGSTLAQALANIESIDGKIAEKIWRVRPELLRDFVQHKLQSQTRKVSDMRVTLSRLQERMNNMSGSVRIKENESVDAMIEHMNAVVQEARDVLSNNTCQVILDQTRTVVRDVRRFFQNDHVMVRNANELARLCNDTMELKREVERLSAVRDRDAFNLKRAQNIWKDMQTLRGLKRRFEREKCADMDEHEQRHVHARFVEVNEQMRRHLRQILREQRSLDDK